MSDIPMTAEAAPETAINPSDFDTGAPTPLGSQVPPDTQPQPLIPESQADKNSKSLDASLDRAFAKLEAKQQAEDKDAPAGKEKADGKEPAAKPDDKPVEKPEAKEPAKPQQERGEHGHFVAKEQKAPAQGVEAGTEPEAGSKPSEGDKPYHQAPSRFTEAAKAEWANAPESVKAETYRAFDEMSRGLQEHQQRWQAIKPYHDLAEQNGTKLTDAMDRYIAFDRDLSSDLVGGLDRVIRDKTGGQLGLYEIAAHVMGMEPDQAQQQTSKAQHATEQRLAGIEQTLQRQEQQRTEERNARMQTEVVDFWAKNPDAEALAPFMAAQLGNGASLQVAYDRAKEYAAGLAQQMGFIPPNAASRSAEQPLNPAPLTQTPPVNPAGQKSINGSPTNGAVKPGSYVKGKPLPSVDQTLKKLFG